MNYGRIMPPRQVEPLNRSSATRFCDARHKPRLIAAIFMSLAGCGVDNNGRYEGRDNVTTMIEDDDEEDRRRWCCFWCRRG